jgi:phosphonate transport system ATP-binding protein
MTALLDARHLSKRYLATLALDEASLTVGRGELVAVLGPSGSGKTTLFRCLTRLVEPDSGEIFLTGRPLHNLEGQALATARRNMAVVFQQFNLVRRLTARENVLAGRLASMPLWRVLLSQYTAADLDLARDALAAVGLTDQCDQRADTLSGGQQQRVAIARALAQNASLILADEPVASLDPATAEVILKLLHGLTRSHGIGVLCTLHQPELAARYADRIIRMDAGRICADVRAESVDHEDAMLLGSAQ